MKKRVLVLVLLSLVLVSMISSFVLAADDLPTPEAQSAPIPQYNPDIDMGVEARASILCLKLGLEQPNDAMLGDQSWFCKTMAQWETGVNWSSPNDVAWAATFIKYFLLLLIIILLWSSMSYVNFPKNVIFKIVMAVLVGFLLTFMISGSEIITAMTSFSAAGIALIVFFPIFVLFIFTLLVAAKSDPFGMFTQRILWIIYGLFLIFRAGSMALFRYYAVGMKTPGSWADPNNGGLFSSIVQFFLGDAQSYAYAQYASPALITTLFIVGIMVLVIMGSKSNEAITHWIGHEKRAMELEGYKGDLDRSKKKIKADSEFMQNEGKK